MVQPGPYSFTKCMYDHYDDKIYPLFNDFFAEKHFKMRYFMYLKNPEIVTFHCACSILLWWVAILCSFERDQKSTPEVTVLKVQVDFADDVCL